MALLLPGHLPRAPSFATLPSSLASSISIYLDAAGWQWLQKKTRRGAGSVNQVGAAQLIPCR